MILSDNSTESLIHGQLLEWGRGRIFFAQDFATASSAESVRKALCSLTESREIVRLARGIYCYPKIEGEYSIRTVYPSTETIAEAVALKSRSRIVPCGDEAAYRLGLSGLRMAGNTYLTDGAPRVIKTNYTTITFRHTSETRIFSFRNSTMQLLSLAVRALGKEGFTRDVAALAAEHLGKVPPEEFEHDLKLCPAWVAELLSV